MSFDFFLGGGTLNFFQFFYSSDSGAQYYDGTCDTTRTVHFGRPTPEMSEAYTRVLQGHVSLFFSFRFHIHIIFIH